LIAFVHSIGTAGEFLCLTICLLEAVQVLDLELVQACQLDQQLPARLEGLSLKHLNNFTEIVTLHSAEGLRSGGASWA
jgi:hypothetical protein